MSNARQDLILETARSAVASEAKSGLDLYTLPEETRGPLDYLFKTYTSAAQETIGGYLSQLGSAPTDENLEDLWTRVEEDVDRCCLYRFCVDKIDELKDTEYVATSLMLRDKAWTKLSNASFKSMVREMAEDRSSPSVATLTTDEGEWESGGALMRRDSSSVPDVSDVPELV